MPRVLFLDTKPHIYDVLKRKFEREGFEVIADSDNHHADLIVRGKTQFGSASQMNDFESHTPMIVLSEETFDDDENQAKVAHLKMPFRPSQLMTMARQAVSGAL